jgi:predicted RNase H-like HicB family nuclease
MVKPMAHKAKRSDRNITKHSDRTVTRYAALIDGKKGAYGLIVPDLPGCTSAGTTLSELMRNAIEAVRLWVDDAQASGQPVPPPRSYEAIVNDPEVRKELAHGAMLTVVPLLRDSGRPARANVSFDAALLEALDEAAEARNLTRSAFIASAVREKIRGEAT